MPRKMLLKELPRGMGLKLFVMVAWLSSSAFYTCLILARPTSLLTSEISTEQAGLEWHYLELCLVVMGTPGPESLALSSVEEIITSFQRVPKGTNGGVTFIGLLSSVVGGLVIGFAYYLGVMMSAASVDMEVAPNQMLVIVAGGLGGLLGSVLDSLLGASLQFSGKDAKSGKIVEVAREDVVPISGKMVLDNHSVNLVSSILTALLLPKFALSVGL